VFLRAPAAADAGGAAGAPPSLAAGSCTLAQVLAAYAQHLKRRQPPQLVIEPLALMSVDDALARLRAGLGAAPGWESLLRYLPAECLDGEAEPLVARAALAATFVACLELARDGALRIRQARPFGPIFVVAVNVGEAVDG
jgi:segregation and condensation protein A